MILVSTDYLIATDTRGGPMTDDKSCRCTEHGEGEPCTGDTLNAIEDNHVDPCCDCSEDGC